MRAMVLRTPRPIEESPLELSELPTPELRADELLVHVRTCGVCHTDLHTVEGEITGKLPIVPGHQIVGVVEKVGRDVHEFASDDRVGLPWLYRSCGLCEFCKSGRENLCDRPEFTGFHVNGGYAECVAAPAAFAVKIPDGFDDAHAAPLLCAGIVGYRALRLALNLDCPTRGVRADSDLSTTKAASERQSARPAVASYHGMRLGLYGFGASAHIVLQIAVQWGCEVFVATRGAEHQRLAKELGASWAGRAEEVPAATLHAAAIFAPAGTLVPQALRALRKGATLALAGIYMTPIPELKYELLYHERMVRSVANATREDARQLMQVAGEIPLRTEVQAFQLTDANQALIELKQGRIRGAAVLLVN